MLNDIIVGLSQAIDNEFNTDVDTEYEIHTEDISQDLSGRTFIITIVNSQHTRALKDRFIDNVIVSVQYFPESENESKSECYQVQNRLEQAIEMIMVNENTVIGHSIESRVSDDVLVTNVTYSVRTYREDSGENMEVLELEVGVSE